MKQYKHVLYKYFVVVLSIPTVLFFLLYLYDPLQIFHKPFLREKSFHSNMREQAAGVINNYDFDSILLGTSMLANLSAEKTSKLFNQKFINISMSGSDFYERSLVLNYALKKKKIKTVLYSLDAFSYLEQRKGHKSFSTEEFDFLYDDNKLNDIKAYLNSKYINCLLTFSNNSKCIGGAKDLNYPNEWFSNKKKQERFGGIDNWFKKQTTKDEIKILKQIIYKAEEISNGKSLPLINIKNKNKKAIKYVDNYILSIIKKHPGTKFILFFPPYSRFEFALWAQYDKSKFEVYKNIVLYLSNQSTKLQNLKVFAFGNEEFMDNISNYKDTLHYHKSKNLLMLSHFNKNINLITSKNNQKYIKTIDKKSNEYNITKISSVIKSYINN